MIERDFEQLFRQAMTLVARVGNWDNQEFDWAKSYVASVFSLAAYQEVPGFELRDTTRAKLIPCDIYQRVYATGLAASAREVLLSLTDSQQIRVIVQRGVVAIVANVRNVIFVAFRGTTATTSDLIADVKAWKHYANFGHNRKIGFHSGFYSAVAQGFMEVCDAIVAVDPSGKLPLYVVGHSLGGAMAAIFSINVKWSYRFRPSPAITAEYVFGAPRYCDASALYFARPPHQICNQFDAIPSVPSRKWGYVDPPGAKFLQANGSEIDHLDRGDSLKAWRDGVENYLSFAEHRLEQYIKRCELAARQAHPELFP